MAPTDTDTIHIFFNPLSARGHTLPLVAAAWLFAGRPGVRCTVVTTRGNSSYIVPTIEAAKAAGLPLDLLLLGPFPYAEVGLPPGVECSDALPSDNGSQEKLGIALFLLRDRFRDLVLQHRPDCIISDNHMFWNADLALSLSVPYFVFSVFSSFSKAIVDAVITTINLFQAKDACSCGADVIRLTGLPHPLELTMAEIPLFARKPGWLMLVAENEGKSSGVIFNTVYELEPEYVDHYARTNLTGAPMKLWSIGPVQLHCDNAGGVVSNDFERSKIKRWLDSKHPRSVLYVCFGTDCHFTAEQTRQIAVGLQSCRHCFIWVVRTGGVRGAGEWLPESFHQTVGDRGLILSEWAPQVAILNHPATGGAVLHCGWNSTMEVIWAGLPAIAWPLHTEQFITERLVVEVLGIGLRILEGPAMRSLEPRAVVDGEAVRDAVDRLMGGGPEAAAMRQNALKYQKVMKSAATEGGSSRANIGSVIELIKEEKKKKRINEGGKGRLSSVAERGKVVREAVKLAMGRAGEEAVREIKAKSDEYQGLATSDMEQKKRKNSEK